MAPSKRLGRRSLLSYPRVGTFLGCVVKNEYMQISKIPKEQIGDKVLFPRTQLQGLSCSEEEKPQREDFKTVIQQVEGNGEVTLIEQTAWPRHVFQLFKTESEEQFDDYLGKLLGMHDPPSYIEGRTDFIVLFQGSHDHVSITQENHTEVYQQICRTQDDAARWWHCYGS